MALLGEKGRTNWARSSTGAPQLNDAGPATRSLLAVTCFPWNGRLPRNDVWLTHTFRPSARGAAASPPSGIPPRGGSLQS